MVRYVGAGNIGTRDEWPDCCWPSCEQVVDGGGPPLCAKHLRKAGIAWFAAEGPGVLLAGVGQGTAPEGGPSVEGRRLEREKAMQAQSQVYYVRIGDHVKIGYSINMRQRLGALRVNDIQLLATEPGGRELEGQRHSQFAAERVGRREDFNPSPRLLAWIEEVKRRNGPPRITSYRASEAVTQTGV